MCSGLDRLLCLCFLVSFFENYENTVLMETMEQNTKPSESLVNVTLKFLNDHIDELKFSKSQQIVFVIGADNSIKTTLVSLITRANIEVIETGDSGLSIIDKDGPLNQYPPNIVTELMPQLLTDKSIGVDYFILPSANSELDVKNDLTLWHLIQRSLHFATGVKFMLTLTYPPKETNEISQFHVSPEGMLDIRHLIRNAILLINSIEKYSEALCLTVTNVENDPRKSDREAIQYVAYGLRLAMDQLVEEQGNPNISSVEMDLLDKGVQLLRILLTDESSFPKIKIMRLANETGMVSDISFLQYERVEVTHMVRTDTKYVQNSVNDFSFNILETTREHVPELIEEVERKVQADFPAVEEEMIKVFVEFEKDEFDSSILLDKMEYGHQIFSQIQVADPKSLAEQIIAALDGLNIEISSDTLDDTLKHVELYNFMTSLQVQNKRESLQVGVETITRYLKQSGVWYNYLKKLHDELSEYKVQKYVKDYRDVTVMLMELCTIAENKEVSVSDIGLREFVEHIGNEMDPEVDKLTVNAVKLQKLKNLLQHTMFDYGTHSCLPDRQSVQGYNVKMSDVIKMKCNEDENINIREIFVVNNFFVDADMKLVGENPELNIIALRWEIINSSLIEMRGRDGPPHEPARALDGTRDKIHGQAGKPGEPGSPGGCFMAIGDTFVKDELLQVRLMGGRGGPGQHGGNGHEGQDAEPVTAPKYSYEAEKYFQDNGFSYTVLQNGEKSWGLITDYYYYTYLARQKDTIDFPGNGGAGGMQGHEGQKGKVFFLGLEHRPSFPVDNEKGEKGSIGIGGRGGQSVTDDKEVQIQYVNEKKIFHDLKYNLPSLNDPTGGRTRKSKDGKDNKNDAGIKQPSVAEFKNPSHAINRYKSYLRENLAENCQEGRIRKFIIDLETNTDITSLYNTASFAHELHSLEDHYLRLRSQIPFSPFYESLKTRIIEYEKSFGESADYRKAFNFLYMSVMKKLSHLRNKELFRNFKSHASIIDLLEYLEIVQKNIRKMDAIEADISITEQTKDYQNSLYDKVTDAVNAVNNEVVTVLFELFDPLSQKIVDLIVEIVIDREKKKKEQQDVEEQMRQQSILGAFNIFSSVFKLFGEGGKLLSSLTLVGASIYESIAESDRQRANIVNSFKSHTEALKEIFKEPYRLYDQQLDFMLSKITEDTPHNVTQLIREHKREVEGYLDGDSFLDIRRVYEMRKDLNQALNRASVTWDAAEAMIKKVTEIVDISLEIWNQIKDNEKKLNELHERSMALKKDIEGLNDRIQEIITVLFPLMYRVEETMTQIAGSIENQTQIEIVITGWKVQQSMSKFKQLTRQIADGFSTKDAVVHLIENIEEAFNTMTTIYDRIQSYIDQSKFAGFVGGLHTNQDIKDPLVKEMVAQLKRVLQSNVVLEQYDLAMHSFKQHFFPFATTHLLDFDFSSSFQTNDTAVLTRRASEEIDYLQDQLKFLEVSIGKYDREIFGQIYFDINNVSIAKPFYIFRSREFGDLFKSLLRGEEIMINADIANGLKQNAIKFNEIGIHLKLIEEEMQGEFDAYLQHFGVRMSLIGNVYYRCANHFYYLPVDDNIIIEYSFKKDLNQKPIIYNEAYRKLSENHYFLSPYATWKIQLTITGQDFGSEAQEDSLQISFLELAKNFEKFSFNLELVGRGQYFRSKGVLETEICTDEVSKYYEVDDSLSSALSPQRLKSKYYLH